MGLIRWLQKLLGMAAFSLIIVSLTLATSWFAVQFAFDRWMTQSDSYLPDFLSESKSDLKNEEKSMDENVAVMASGGPVENDRFAQSTSPSPTNHQLNDSPTKKESPNSQTKSKSTQTTPDTKDVIVDAEQFSSAKNGLTNQEKLRIYELFIKRVPEKELKKVVEMLEGGISDEELKKIRVLLKTHFPKAEQEELESLGNRWAPIPTTSPKSSSKPTPHS